MAEQYFHPYYNQWDDGTIGMSSISKGEEAAVRRAFKWNLQRQEMRGAEPKTLSSLVDPMSYPGKPIPMLKILDPLVQKEILRERLFDYDRSSRSFDAWIRHYQELSPGEQEEAYKYYPAKKEILDHKRIALARQQRNFDNADWLAWRDQKIEELRKSNRSFARDVDRVYLTARTLERYSDEYGLLVDKYHRGNAKIEDLHKWLRHYSAQRFGITPSEFKTREELENTYRRIVDQIADLEIEENKLKSQVEAGATKINKLVDSKEFKSAHVNASNKLTRVGLNRVGVPLAGRLLSAPGIAADVSQIAAIAGVGPMKNYDNTGATYTNDEVVKVDEVKRVRSEVDELAAYHPDNAKNHPEISDLDRINFFRKRGANEQVLSGLPGYKSWKAEQVQAEAEITKKLEMLNLNR